MFTDCFHLNIPTRTVVRRTVGNQTVFLDGSSDMDGTRELLLLSPENQA